MTDTATAVEPQAPVIQPQYETIFVPPSKIYSDTQFNCRGEIKPAEVLELAKDIRARGLDFPIAVQPREDTLTYATVPEEYDFRIIAGHRRFKAMQLLKYDLVPCMVKRGYTELQCLVTNIGENLKRQDLNILQEARSLEKLWKAGVPRNDVARVLDKSSGWVQARYYLLDMPEDIQQEAALGIISQHQIKQLYSLDSDGRIEAIKKIKNAKANHEKVPHVGKRKKTALDVKKPRDQAAMVEMSELLAKNLGFGLVTRVLAWASGYITTKELFDDVRAEKTTGLTSKLVAYANGDMDGDELLKELGRDSEIKLRPFIFPEEL